MKKFALISLLFSLMIMIAIGCSNASNETGNETNPTTPPNQSQQPTSQEQQPTSEPEPVVEKEPDPVTITIGRAPGAISDELFESVIVESVKKKYPHITLESVLYTPQNMQEQVAAGVYPDIISNWASNFPQFQSVGLAMDMDELIEKHNFDITQIDPVIINTIKEMGQSDSLIALPLFNNQFALFYNKAVFDRLNVEYPRDNMTWQDVYELALRMTREVEGVQYRGIYPDNPIRGLDQMGIRRVDLETMTPLLDSPEVIGVYKLWESMLTIPGNFVSFNVNHQREAFIRGEIAMLAGWSAMMSNFYRDPNLDWDMVTYPQNPAAPGIGFRVDTNNLSVTSTSEHKDEAFKVIMHLLSEEVQTELSRRGFGPVIQNEQAKSQFGLGIPELEGKNLQAFVALDLNKQYSMGNVPATVFNPIANGAMNEILDGKDVNTALREANEIFAQRILELQNQ